MNILRLSAMAIAAAFLCSPAALADTTPIAIAVVNIQQIMHDSTAAQSVREQLDGKQKAFQAEISKKQEQLQKEDQDLGKERSVLSKTAFEEKSRAFSSKVTAAQKEVQSKKALLDSAAERALGEIQKTVNDIITGLGKEKGFIIAIPSSELLYADSRLDITKDVLSRLNDKLPKVEVKFDAGK